MVYKSNAIPIKIPMVVFTEIEKTFLNFFWTYRIPWMATVILRKKNKAGLIMLHDFKLYYKGM